MPYNGKTDWKLDEMVYPEDMNRIEGQIEKNTSEIEGVSGKIGNPSDGEEQLTLFGKLAAILAKVLGIDTKVGTSDDAKTKPTLFGKIAGIGDTLSENLTPVTEKITEVLNKVTGIDGKIGTSSDSSNTDTLFGKIQAVKESTAAKRYMFSETVQETKEGYDFMSIRNSSKAMSVILFSKVAEYDGTIGFSTTLNLNSGNTNDYLAVAAFTPSTIRGSGSYLETNLEQVFFKPERTVYGPQEYGKPYIPFVGPEVNRGYKNFVNMKFMSTTDGNTSIDTTVIVKCKKGEKVILLGMARGTDVSNKFNIGQVQVKYDVIGG